MARQVIEEEPGSDIDGGDVFAGIVVLIAIPALTYVLLSFAGMPVNGNTTDIVAKVREKDRLADRPPPPPTEPELNDKLAYVEQLKERANGYLARVTDDMENIDVDRWQQHALRTLNKAKSELSLLEADMKKAPDLASFETKINRQLTDINRRLVDIEKASRFLKN